MRKVFVGLALVLTGITVLGVGTVAVLYVTHPGDHSVPATTAHDADVPAVELDDYRFHAETFGDPAHRTVIILHGGPGGDYRSILPLRELADEYFVVFYDQRGGGLSPRVDEADLNVDRYVKDLGLFVDRFSPNEPVYLIGHSWGAMLASIYIGRHPTKVDRAVLAEPGFLDHEHMEIWNERTGLANMRPSGALMLAMVDAWAESLHVAQTDGQERSDYLMARFMGTEADDHPLGGYYRNGDIRNAAGEMWRYGSLAARAVQASGMDESGRLMDLAAGVENWNGEALFLAGSENTIIGPEYQLTQIDRFPRASLAVIEGAGHTMIGEKPEIVIPVIREFLKAGDNESPGTSR